MSNFKFDLTDEQINVLSVVLDDYSDILQHIGYHFRRNSISSDFFVVDVITLRTEFNIQVDAYLKSLEDGNKSVSK